jgi:hypothetical protein
MKLGCIFKSLVIIIVLIGTTFYLYEKYGKDIIEVGTEKAKQMAVEELEKVLEEFSTETLSDAMKAKVKELTEDFDKNKDEFTFEQWSALKKKFDEAVKEKKIDEKTIEEFKKIINSTKK